MNKLLHFHSISPVQVFTGSAKAEIW